MKKIAMLLLTIGILVSGCGGYLAQMNNERWANSINRTDVDKDKFAIDHGYCCSYAAKMINIPFMDGLGTITSTHYYEKCMKKKGYRLKEITKE